MKDVEARKAADLERNVLEFWDRVYEAWLMSAIESSSVGPLEHIEGLWLGPKFLLQLSHPVGRTL